MFWIGAAPAVPGIRARFSSPGQAFLQRPHHQAMPGDAGPGADHCVVSAVFQETDVTVAEHQHGARQVFGDQYVAAGTQYQQGTAGHFGQCQHFRQQCGIVQFQQLRGAGLHVEGVQRLQWRIAGERPAQRGVAVDGIHGRAHSGATAPRLGASRRRRIASTHSETNAGPRKIKPL